LGIDVLFVNPGNAKAIYQDLATDFSAIEPPTWALLLAESVRSVGFGPAILDVNAERLSIAQAVERISEVSPRLICFVVYGQNPNSGTVNMSGVVALADAVKASGISIPVAAVLQTGPAEPSGDASAVQRQAHRAGTTISNLA